MYVLSNTTEQTLTPNQTTTFNAVVQHQGCGMSHRANSGLVSIRKPGLYLVSFSGNVTGTAAGTVQLSVALDGEALAETTMTNSIATAGDPENVSGLTLVRVNCNCCVQLSVKNTGTTDVVINANPAFVVTEVPQCRI